MKYNYLYVDGSVNNIPIVLLKPIVFLRPIVFLERNPSYKAYFWRFLLFWPRLVGKWVWSAHWLQRAWGLETQPKSWPNEWNFRVKCYLANRFSK